jgi:hypothetical protein
VDVCFVKKFKNIISLAELKEQSIWYIAPNKNIEIQMKKLILDFNKNIKLQKTAEEKIKLMINLVYMLEHLHPFIDANLRTFVNCLLIHLLLQQGYPPPIFF